MNNKYLTRWLSQQATCSLDDRLCGIQRSMRHHKQNIYRLNSMALKI